MPRSKAMQEYFDALDRLKNNEPIRVPVGSAINKDTVALEAGRSRGYIRESRHTFKELLEEINKASAKINEPKITAKTKTQEAKQYKEMYEAAIARELMYLERINELEKKLEKVNPMAVNNV